MWFTRLTTWSGCSSDGWSRPMAATISASAWTVFVWNWWTRCGLVGHDERPLQLGVLGGHADRALVGVAALRLDAADGEHEAAGRVAPVGTERHRPGHRRGGDQLAAGADLHPVADAGADEDVLHEHAAPRSSGRAERVGELQRGGAGAALAAVDDDEVRVDVGREHGLDDGHELDRVADADLEADRLAAGQLTQLA